jgi:hypothetical protein
VWNPLAGPPVLLSARLWRVHAIPAWIAIDIPAAMITNIAGLSVNSVPIALAGFALLLAAFARTTVTVHTSPPGTAPTPGHRQPGSRQRTARPHLIRKLADITALPCTGALASRRQHHRPSTGQAGIPPAQPTYLPARPGRRRRRGVPSGGRAAGRPW